MEICTIAYDRFNCICQLETVCPFSLSKFIYIDFVIILIIFFSKICKLVTKDLETLIFWWIKYYLYIDPCEHLRCQIMVVIIARKAKFTKCLGGALMMVKLSKHALNNKWTCMLFTNKSELLIIVIYAVVILKKKQSHVPKKCHNLSIVHRGRHEFNSSAATYRNQDRLKFTFNDLYSVFVII